MHIEILKRCGRVLIVIGVVDIGYMIWCVSHGESYSSSFNIFALIGGILLVRGSLKTAKWVVLLSSFTMVACLGLLITLPFFFPLGYWLAELRSNPTDVVVGGLVAIGMFALLYWLRKQLQHPDVIRAQTEASIRPASALRAIIGGILLPIFFIVMFVLLLRGDTAKEAIRRAQLQLGGGYHYVVTNMHISTSGAGKSVSAIVCAYNDSELKNVQLDWKE